ncbi:hypothetical protein MMC10_007182 [Thelotrema lepadinum]|nr:hypothetical protein [Thelotrema lepadinum]
MDPQRVPISYWQQRLHAARSMGLNTVFSYVYWNLLEPVPGTWLNDTGSNDIATYFSLAAEEGLNVVLRPGPYICGEREWGGFPSWLSSVPGLEVRSDNALFLDNARGYLEKLMADIAPLQATRGGPLLMVQVENEYGSYGADHAYTAALRDILRANLDNGTVLYTNDGGVEFTLTGGQVPNVLAEIDGDPRGGFPARDEYITDPSELGPLLDGEYYTLAPDNWGANVSHQAPDQQTIDGFVSDLNFVLGGNNSISLYMFHGGTNFGFGNGAIWRNRSDVFTTSYDYGAPLDESGRTTPLYHQLRETLVKYAPSGNGSVPDVAPDLPLSTIPDFELQPVASLGDLVTGSSTLTTPWPVTMESLNQSYGYVLYEHTATASYSGTLQPGDRPRDRIIAYVNGTKVGVIDSIYEAPAQISLSLTTGDKLQLLVENLGRVDYWSLESGTFNALLEPHKGIVGNVTVDGTVLENWRIHSLPFDSVPNPAPTTTGNTTNSDIPLLYKGNFSLNQSMTDPMELDTFLAIPSGTKGVVWVNGFNLGRYWIVGPQQSLYLPGTVLKQGGEVNEVVVLELEPGSSTEPMIARGEDTREWANYKDPDAP